MADDDAPPEPWAIDVLFAIALPPAPGVASQDVPPTPPVALAAELAEPEPLDVAMLVDRI
jgi:hypothetical protein